MSLAAEMNEFATHVLAIDDSAADRNLLRLSPSSPLPRVSTHANATPRSSTGSVTDEDRRPECLVCVLKTRKGYQGFVIEAKVHEGRDGGFLAEISIEDHDRCGVTAKQFYVPNIFEAPDQAMEFAIQMGQRVKADLKTRQFNGPNS